jgi:hypothetical protein
MGDSTTKRIDRVLPGDHVLSLDEQTGRLFAAEVRRLVQHTVPAIVMVHLAGGETIATSLRQMFVTTEGQRLAGGQLEAGQTLRTSSGLPVRIIAVRRRPGAGQRVFRLDLKDAKTYHAGRAALVVPTVKTIDLRDSFEDIIRPLPAGGPKKLAPKPSESGRTPQLPGGRCERRPESQR